MDIKIGDKVQVGSRIGANPAWGTVVDIIPRGEYRPAMYRVRFDIPTNRDGRKSETVTITPNPNECWIDEPLVIWSKPSDMEAEYDNTDSILQDRFPFENR